MAPRAHALPAAEIEGAPIESRPAVTGCQVCRGKTGDDGALCRTCTVELDRDLCDIPDLWTELDITATCRDALAPTSDRPGGGDRMVWNERAVQAATELRLTLTTWGADIANAAEDASDPWRGCTTVPLLAEWVRRNLPALRHLPDAGKAFDEIMDSVRRARRAIDTPDNRTRFHVGPCPEVLTTGACDGAVWAFIPTSTDRDAALRCQSCGASWNTVQWLRVGKRMLTRIRQLRVEAAGRGESIPA